MSLRGLLAASACGLVLTGCSVAQSEDNAPPITEEQPVVPRSIADATDTSNRAELTDREVSDRFIEIFYNRNQLVAGFEAWVHPDYIQHDPNSPTGRDATIEVLRAHMAVNPQMTHDVKRVIYGTSASGETMVAVHYHFKRAPDDRGSAVVDLYRVKDGYLVEHWDVIQPVPEDALNDNTMF